MKRIFLLALMAGFGLASQAQTSASSTTTTKKLAPGAPVAKPSPAKAAASKSAAKKAPAKKAPEPVKEAYVEPDIELPLLATAGLVQTGDIPCELGQKVKITPDKDKPGYFDMTLGKEKFRLSPVASKTGAIRLEDPRSGATWMQLANKSMLLNTREGKRLADECMSPAQASVAEGLKLNPPIGLLDPLPKASAPAAPAASATPTSATAAITPAPAASAAIVSP